MVKTVKRINASLDEEVFVQVVLDTDTGHGHGSAIISVVAVSLELLVSQTGRDIGEDIAGTEVVDRFDLSQLAVDIFIGDVIDFQVPVLTQTSVEQYVLGDEIANAATHQGAIVQTIHAVGEVTVSKGFNLDRPGFAGSHGRKAGRSNSSTNNETHSVFQFHL